MSQKIKQLSGVSIVSWLLLLSLGFFLFFQAEMTLLVISYTIGLTLLISGMIPIMRELISKNNEYLSISFITSIFSTIAGLIILLNHKLIVSIIPLLIGIILMINGIYKLQISLFLKKQNYKKWSLHFIFAITILLCGILFVINPFSGAKAITETFGIFIIIYTICDIVGYFVLRKTFKNITVVEKDNIKIIEQKEE